MFSGTGEQQSARRYRLRAPNDESAPKVVRDLLAAILAASGRPGMVEAARVCVSDVVANVLRHAKVPVLAVEVSVLGDRVIVGVLDGDPDGRPRVVEAAGDAESGRGLLLLERLAHAWGVSWTGGLAPTGKRVWFELREGCGDGCAHAGVERPC